VDTRRILNKAEGQQWQGGGLGKAGGFFLFCPSRLKVIFLIVSKAVASFSQPLMPAVRVRKGFSLKAKKYSPEEIGNLLSDLFIEEINEYFKTEWVQKYFCDTKQSILFREWLFFNSFMMFQGVSAYFQRSEDGHLVLDAFHKACGKKFVQSKVFNNHSNYFTTLLSRYETYSELFNDPRPPNPLYWIAKQFCHYCGNKNNIIPITAAAKWFSHCSVANKELVKGLVEKL